MRLLARIPGGEVELSGGLTLDGKQFDGRLKIEGDRLDQFVSSLGSVSGSSGNLSGQPTAFVLDARLQRRGVTGSLVSRKLQVGQSQGAIQTSLTFGDKMHLAGKVTLSRLALAEWLDVRFSAPQTAAGTGKTATTPLAADLEMAIGSVDWNGETIQRIDASVRARDGVIDMYRFQALLPGGGGLRASARYRKGHTEGSYSLKGGNGRPLLGWFGLPVENFSAERFAVVQLVGDFSSRGTVWNASVKDGKLDTTGFSLEASGDTAGPAGTPIVAKLRVDALDLDRYMPTGKRDKPAATSDKAMMPAVQLGLSAGQLVYRQQVFAGIQADMSLSGKGVKFDGTSARAFGQGKLEMHGAITDIQALTGLDITATATKVSGRQLARMASVPQANVPRRLQGALDAEVAIKGGESGGYDLALQAAMPEGGTFTALGKMTLKEAGGPDIDLQGVLRDRVAAPWARDVKFAMDKAAGGIDLIYSISRAGGKDRFKASGTVADGRLVMDGAGSGGASQIRIRYDRDSLQGISDQLSRQLGAKTVAEPLAMKGVIAVSADEVRFSDMDIALGDTRLTGMLGQQNTGLVDGQLVLTGLVWDGGPEDDTASQLWSDEPFDFGILADQRGRISLKLEKSRLYGQRLDATTIYIGLDEGTINLRADEASLNDAPMQMQAQVRTQKGLGLDAQADIASLDLKALMKSLAGIAPVSGTGKVKLALQGEGRSPKAFVASLDGSLHSSGRAGSLDFINVLALANKVRSARSGRDIIAGIGQSMAGGITSYANLDIAIDIRDGMADMTGFDAVGNWGKLSLAGVTNLVAFTTDLKGQLQLDSPPDAPPVPVRYRGALAGPKASWKTDILQNFVMSGISRRLRSDLFKQAKKQQEDGQATQSPGEAATSTALGFIRLIQKKRAEEAARKKAEAEAAAAKKKQDEEAGGK